MEFKTEITEEDVKQALSIFGEKSRTKMNTAEILAIFRRKEGFKAQLIYRDNKLIILTED